MAKEFIVYSKTKAEFEALVSSGEVDTSQIGIIAETGEMWWNGEYRPIAETVPFANDLTGRIEATPEEFTFRPSAGDKSIRDESALIKKIKGNTIVWNQLATFRQSGTINGLVITNENNELRVSGTLTEALSYDILQLTSYLPQGLKRDGRKYLISLNAPDGVAYGINGYPITNTKPHFWSDTKDTVFHGYMSIKIPLGTTVDYVFSNPQIIDLTQMFGVGNEPSTVEEFKALFPNEYYDYNAGELVSMTSNGLFANGFNQFNGEYAEVLPNNTYYLGGTYTTIGFTEEIGGTLEDITIPTDKLYTPTKKGYIYTTGTNININLSHTGVRNGEYEPYWDATKDLSIIQKYFPNGMRSAGSIYDEISFDEATQKWVAIQRVGSVDLGNLEWTKRSDIKGVVFQTYLEKAFSNKFNAICTKYIVKANTYPNALSFYENSEESTIGANYNSVYPNLIFCKDSSYADNASFKNAMSGVMLYYELAEPIITTIEEPIDLSYKVGDFGIEKMLSDSFSAPFKADIVYQFNATDRVRENSMNISKLSKKHNLLESEVDALESKALTKDAQTLTADQKAQVASNLGGNTENGLVRYVESTIPVESFAAPNASGVTSKYAFPNASDAVKENANGIIATESFVNTKVLPISNEIGGLRTSVQSANNTANTAHREATTARTEVSSLDTYTKGEVEKLNTEIDNLDEDVSEIRGLIGDEYNIWFEIESQKNDIPTLENFPANNWVSDEDYYNHDRDLYYSISLGRAWRFNYNEGTPIWEEITDAFTIAALTKAEEAVSKANEAIDAVNGLQYIVSAFPEENVLNTSAVILGRLIAVKDGSSNVVAGLYGGDNADLDTNGYSHDEYGTLLMFAGSPSAEKVNESDFKVYENGRVEIKTGVFTGLTKHKVININNSNVDKFFPITTGGGTTSDGSSIARRALSPDVFTSITRFNSTFSKYNDISVYLPAIYNYSLKDDLGEFTKDELRELAGNTFYIYNDSSAFIHLCGYSYDEDNSTLVGPSCFGDGVIEEGEFAKITCVLDVISGKEILYWRYTIGRTRQYIMPLEE